MLKPADHANGCLKILGEPKSPKWSGTRLIMLGGKQCWSVFWFQIPRHTQNPKVFLRCLTGEKVYFCPRLPVKKRLKKSDNACLSIMPVICLGNPGIEFPGFWWWKAHVFLFNTLCLCWPNGQSLSYLQKLPCQPWTICLSHPFVLASDKWMG